MTKEELASKLNGREIGNEITEQEEKEAKWSGLVVLFGASDDLCEIRGHINDECGVYDGGVIPFVDGDLLRKECEDDSCPHEEKIFEKSIKIKAVWCKDESACWTYETDLPHATFDIMEDGKVFSRGIILDIKDLK